MQQYVVMFLVLMAVPAMADTLDGRIASLDTNLRQLTLETGETLNLLDTVSIDQLAVQQAVHLTLTDGTVDAVSVDITEDTPISSSQEDASGSLSSTDAEPGTTIDSNAAVIDDSSSADDATSSDAAANPIDTTGQSSSMTESDAAAVENDTTTVTDGSSVDYGAPEDQEN